MAMIERAGRRISFGDTAAEAIPGAGGDDGVVLAFHGTTQDRTAWNLVRDAFPGTHRWITPEFPGSGESTASDTPLEVEEFVADALAVLDATGVNRCHVVGYSLGAVAALAMAATAPERVASVTSLCGWATTDGRMRITFQLWRKLIAVDPALFMHYALADGMTRLSLEAIEPMFGEVVELSTVAIAPGSDAHLELDERVDISGLVRDITCPALVIGAIEDRWVDVVHSRYLAADIQGARLMELPAGHLVIQEMARDLGPILHAHMVEADDSRIGDADGSAPR